MSLKVRVNEQEKIVKPLAELPQAVTSAIESASFRGKIEEGSTAVGDALVPAAGAYAMPTVSDFPVGAVVIGATTKALYFGTNMEFVGGPICYTVHAEQAAIVQAYAHGERGITAVCVSAAPCGHCRQLLVEQPAGRDTVIRITGRTPQPLRELLPEAFTLDSDEYKPKAHPALDCVAPDQRPLALIQAGQPVPAAPGCKCRKCTAPDWLTRVAIEAAQRARAPFSSLQSGVALEFAEGEVFAGAYLESAAFNPSMQPINAAFVSARIAGKDLSRIRRAVVVEYGSAMLSNITVTRELLHLLAPSATLSVFQP